jgi:DNA helicase-2/ATP-dependent DNA helicase PcrA
MFGLTLKRLNFLAKPGVIRRELPNSGRSTVGLIDIANHLVLWNHAENPNEDLRDALLIHPLIEPAPPDDPQPNPPDDLTFIRVSMHEYSPADEILAIADSLEKWLPEHMDSTVAVLVPRNQNAFYLVDELRRRNLPYIDDLLRSSSTTRFSAGSLGHILRYLTDPSSSSKLSMVYRVWKRGTRNDEVEQTRVEQVAEVLRKIPNVEDFIWPGVNNDWIETTTISTDDPETYEELLAFRQLVRRWQQSVVLPIDQVVLTVAQDLLTEPGELAIAHKLALLLARAQADHPDWRLMELTNELVVIAKNERRFLGFSESETGFEPDRYKGKIIVSTMHKAKGLEWDRVYLMSINNVDFPSASENDPYISEKWFIRDRLNIEAEVLAELQSLFAEGENHGYREGEATEKARLDYARERLRLLYVGITRAKKELIISWNNGRNGEALPAVPLAALHSYLQNRQKVDA